MSYPPEWPAPGRMHFRLVNDRLGNLDLDCENGYVLNQYNLGFPEVREVKVPNSLDDGNFDVTRFIGARAVSLDVTLKPHIGLTPASPYVNAEAYLRDRLLAYLYPGIRSRLLFSEHGDKRVRQILLRGSQASLAVNKPLYNKVNAAWIAPRGTLAAYDERCYLFRFGETSGETMDLIIVNEGTVPVTWRATISGYSLHPRLILNGREILRLDYVAQPGDVITLDSFSQTITINGQPASYAYIEDDAVWFKIPPGFNTLTVSHAGGVSAYGYPYARWQVAPSAATVDLFERADGALGADWETPTDLPVDTTAVALHIDDGAVIVTEADSGVDPHQWGFARHVNAITGGAGQHVEVDVTNVAQSSLAGPTARSKIELYSNMNTVDAACQALSVDFDFGVAADPTPPVIFEDPFETLTEWTVVGTNATLAVGRNGQGLQVTGTSGYANYNLPGSDDLITTFVAGIAFKITAAVGQTTISSVRNLLEFRGADGATLHGRVAVDAGGSLYATDAAGTNRGGSPLGSVTPNTWHYAEVRYVISKLSGEYALRLDGIDVAGAFDIDTLGASDTVDQIRIPTPNTTSGGTHTYDDFYLAAGDEAAFIGPLDVANGSLAWELHQYDATGVWGHTAGSGAFAYNYDDTPIRVRLESRVDGAQRFILNGTPIAEPVEATPIVGDRVGFGASYATATYASDDIDFTDLFERAALGSDWVLPVARSAGRTAVLPAISAGAAVTTGHTAVPPQMYSTTTSTGTTLAGGVPQTLPGSPLATYLLVARVLQDNPGGVPITASSGWTQLGTARQGTAPGDFREAFDNFAAWATTGTVATVVGRTGNGARITGANTTNHADYVLPTPNATVVVGFAHQINSLAAATSEIAQFYGDTNVTQHNRLTVATNGSLSFWRGATNLGTSAAGVIAINTWNYIEVRTVLSDTVGAVTVRVNGTAVLTLTGLDTMNAGTAAVYDTIRLTGPIASFFNTFDDLYVLTGSGAAFTGSQTITESSGTEFLRMSAFARVLDGTSLDALTLTGAATAYVSAIESYYLSPSGFAADTVSRMKFAATTGVTGFPDPPSLTLGSIQDWLFIASAGMDTAAVPSMGLPTGYSIIHGPTVAPGNLAAMRSGLRTATQSTPENPVAYTGTATRPWIAFTIAIPGGNLTWGAAEYATQGFDPTETVTVEATVDATASGAPYVEVYSHMVAGSPTCRALQVDTFARTWRLGHFVAGTADLVEAAAGALPAGAAPYTLRLESDPDGTERFVFNGVEVAEVLDVTAPKPTVSTRVGFGQFSTTASPPPPQIQAFTATGSRYGTGPPPVPPTSPRIERFSAAAVSGTDWAFTGVGPPNNVPPGGKPPWAWTPPTDPLTGEPSILTVHFCFFDAWL